MLLAGLLWALRRRNDLILDRQQHDTLFGYDCIQRWRLIFFLLTIPADDRSSQCEAKCNVFNTIGVKSQLVAVEELLQRNARLIVTTHSLPKVRF
jgi:hypothetical protein